MTSSLPKGQRITGADRQKLARKLLSEYQRGASIRELAAKHSRSIGGVRRMLIEAGVEFRSRGGARRRAGSTGARGTAKST